MTESGESSEEVSALFGKTVNCDEAVHQLYHFLDGELTEERRLLISEHLTYCAPCGGAVEFEAELRPTFYPGSLHDLAGFYLGAGLSIRYFFGSHR